MFLQRKQKVRSYAKNEVLILSTSPPPAPHFRNQLGLRLFIYHNCGRTDISYKWYSGESFFFQNEGLFWSCLPICVLPSLAHYFACWRAWAKASYFTLRSMSSIRPLKKMKRTFLIENFFLNIFYWIDFSKKTKKKRRYIYTGKTDFGAPKPSFPFSNHTMVVGGGAFRMLLLEPYLINSVNIIEKSHFLIFFFLVIICVHLIGL